MLKDLYKDALSIFPDKKDQEDIKREHDRWPHCFIANTDQLWFSRTSNHLDSDEEYLREALKYASESWKWNPTVIGDEKYTCVDRVKYMRHNMRSSDAYSLTALLELCLSERRYDTYPYEIHNQYQQKAFIDFLKKHKIHDFETMDECRKCIENNKPLT